MKFRRRAILGVYERINTISFILFSINTNMKKSHSKKFTGKGVLPMFGIDLHGWEQVMTLSLMTAGIAAVVVALSTTMVVKLQRQEANAAEAILAKYKEKAGMEIAESNLKASEAIQTAEAERLERLKLEAQIAPRRLNLNQQHGLTAALMKFGGADISVSSYALDADSAAFGGQVLEAIKNASLVPIDQRMSQGALGSMALGVHITGTNAALVNMLLGTFNSFGIQALAGEPPPSSGMSLGGQGVPHSAKIFVGVKPLTK
jgi:hypothetical protein